MRRASFLGEAKDYKPFFAPGEVEQSKAEQNAVIEKIMRFAGSRGAAKRKLWPEQVAKWRPDLVREVYQRPDGTLVDAEGSPIPASEGYVFMPEQQGQDEQSPPQGPDVLTQLFGSE